ncbi:MAG: DNA alkylation repair protein [Leptolyngbya sp. SIOISBB]|nr:DNA alkylation repair protein [Leptolyngbya sp. SIOISBB]
METYLTDLKQLYQQQANPEQAEPMKKYMRNQFEFLGLKSPQAKTLFKQFLAKNGLPNLEQLAAIVRELWTWPEREYQYVALNLLDKSQKQLTLDQLPLLEHLITTKSWWDTVDSLASHNVGKLLSQYPERCDRLIEPWRQSDNIWLRRTTLLFQLGYKTQTDEALLFAIVNENRASSEFFIQKAIGWALREYSKTAPDVVIAFVEATELAPLSRREALKWLKNKGYPV